jgi:hypothetical protein
VKASEKAVEAVFKTAKIGDDVFDAANDASKEAKSRRNAALKDIALRIADAFIAARIGAGCDKTYPQGKHMDGTDKKCFEEVKKLVWKDYVGQGLKNNKNLEKELAQPTRNGYQACHQGEGEERPDHDGRPGRRAHREAGESRQGQVDDSLRRRRRGRRRRRVLRSGRLGRGRRRRRRRG